MKKLHAFCTAAIALALASSCSDGKEKAVRDFATDFATKVQNHQTDSLTAVYPGIEMADSIALDFVADSLSVSPTETEGTYNVTLGNGASIVVRTAEDGTMTVASSKGIFKYPASTIAFAQKVGGIKPGASLTDVQLAEVIGNLESLSADLFDKYVASRKYAVTNGGFRTTKEPMFGMDEGKGYYILKNNSDQPIKADEYEITWLDEWMDAAGQTTKRRITPGLDIPANGTANYGISFSWHGGPSIKAITMKIPSKEQFFENFTPTGNEYDEFIKNMPKAGENELGDGPFTMAGKLGGKHAIHMTINKGLQDGTYYYDKYGPNNTLALSVKNYDKKTGKITLEEQNDKGQVTGNFIGVLTPTAFEGTMTAYTGKSFPFTLTVSK